MNSLTPIEQHSSNSYKSPLNKKRRFVPNSLPVARNLSSPSRPDVAFNSPMLLHVYGQQPSTSDVQTQLFQVGMRVRKSVNEGYQTRPKQRSPAPSVGIFPAGATTLRSWADSTFAMTTPERSWHYTTTNKRSFAQEAGEDSDEADSSPMTPIMPHSDHRVQIPPDYFNINYDFDDMEEDDSSFLVPEESPSRKGVLKARINGRRLAIPKSQKQKQKNGIAGRNLFEEFSNVAFADQGCDRHQSTGTRWLGHERILPGQSPCRGDFEDADFLQRREDVDMDCS